MEPRTQVEVEDVPLVVVIQDLVDLVEEEMVL